jgi:hypothetical protein
MESMKTQSFVVTNESNLSKGLTTKQLHTIQIETKPQQLKTIKEQIEDIKQGAQDTRKISNINQFASYFPKFYKKEIKNAFAIFVIWSILLVLSLGAIAYGVYAIVSSNDSN